MLVTGFILGLMSSLHCVGMCGPLVLALPGSNKPPLRRWLNRINYHLGRSIVYGIMGALAGFIGSGLELFTMQRSVALTGGVIMILLALLPKLSRKIGLPKRLAGEVSSLRSSMLKALTMNKDYAWFGLGGLNAFLPCGPLYIALAGALAMGTWAGGAVFMFLFGMATSMSLLVLQGLKDRVRLPNVSPALIFQAATMIIGVLMILRGLDLGIPYVSPSFDLSAGTVDGCH